MIVVFDGVCNLCNGWVQFIINRDRTTQIRFASIQTPAGEDLLARHGYVAEGLDTLLVVEQDALYAKTEAIRYVLPHLGGIWPWVAALMRVVPRVLRDWMYTRVAINRYTLFGRRAECAIPSASQAARFLINREDVSSPIPPVALR